LLDLLRFLAEAGRSVCARMLRVEMLDEGNPMPRDVPLDQLRRLLAIIEAEAASMDERARRQGQMDRAWFLLMLHGGLRTGEVRRLRRVELDLTDRKVRIEQSKGLKDRVVYLSEATLQALQAYLAVRGPAPGDRVFLYRHQPLSPTYCGERLLTYGKRCGVRVTPHQLRHSCATLLLNAGAPILAVQAILGHEHIDTTLGYARLYDETVAKEYYQAMGQIERVKTPPKDELVSPPGLVQLLALLDALHQGPLDEKQTATTRVLRATLLALAETR
jgi:integrase